MLKEPQRKTILFDLDGTLIDQFQALHRAFNHVLAEFDHPEQDFEAIKAHVGPSLEYSLEYFLGKERVLEAVEVFKTFFDTIMFEDLYRLPGAIWILENLKERNYKLAVFTNKTNYRARHICDELGLTPYLDNIIGAKDTPYVKPQKEYSEYALSTLEACPDTAALIGDSHYDIDAAHAVGMPVYVVTTGTHSKEELENHQNKAHGMHEDLYELGEALFGLVPPLEKEIHPRLEKKIA